jgi:alpha-mannosidase
VKKRKELFLVPYAHLDTQWRWEYPTTIGKYLKNTLEENLRLFARHPGHRFVFTGALRYRMMKEYYPELFLQVKDLIDKGRWSLAGTCLDETDALVPSSESMIRNMLYGDRWQQREFGRTSRDYMIPDCFGFPANMPTILRHCGIRGFSTNKLTWGSAVGIPFEIGIWEGPDGGAVVSALNPCRYDSPLFPGPIWNPWRRARLQRLGRKNGVWKSFQYYGVGDIGGAPREGSVKRALAGIRKTESRTNGLLVRQGSPDEFFSGISSREQASFDRYRGDLLLVNHSAGTLTSATIMKRWNRKNEQLAFAAEAAAVSAALYAGARYPREKISCAWQRVIGNQMHDILPGTSTPTAYEYSQNDEVIALNSWSAILEDAAEAMAPYAPGTGNILLYNPLPENRNDPLFFDVSHRAELHEGPARLIGADSREYPLLIYRDQNGNLTATASPELSALRWERFSIEAIKAGEDAAGVVKDEDNSTDSVRLSRDQSGIRMENRSVSVTFDSRGALVSIYDKLAKRELLSAALAYEFQREKPRQFPAWNMDWHDRRRRPAFRLEGGELTVLLDEPQRCSVKLISRMGKSEFVREVALNAGSSSVECTERIRWFESGYSLKLAIDTLLRNEETTYNWETSRIERGLNHSKCFEAPSRLWVKMTDSDSGFTLTEDSKYGYDRPRPGCLRMTLIYTPATRTFNGFRDQSSHDWGRHTVRYAIRCHQPDFKGSDALARRFNQPVRAFDLTKLGVSGGAIEGASIETSRPILSLDNPQIGVMALKFAEDSDALVLRLYNRSASEQSAYVSTAPVIHSVEEMSGLEEDPLVRPSEERGFPVQLPANGLRTYKIDIEERSGAIMSHDIDPRGGHSSKIEFPADRQEFSWNADRYDGPFPAEQVPEIIWSGDAALAMRNHDAMNALACTGQTLEIPQQTNRITLLVSADAEQSAGFAFLDQNGSLIGTEEHTVYSKERPLGRWDTRIWKNAPQHQRGYHRDYAWLNRCEGVEAGYVKRCRLEWYSTHTHREGRDMPYEYGYLYALRLHPPAGTAALRLPDLPGIMLYSAAATTPGYRARPIPMLIDEFDF